MFHSANCWKKRPVRAKQKAARLFFGPPAAPVQGKGLGPDQLGGALDSCGRIVLITYGEGGQDNCIQRTVLQQSQVALTDNHTGTRNASREREGIAKTGQ